MIELTEDDPLTVEAMVTFFYKGKYNYKLRMEGEEDKKEPDDESGDEPRPDDEEESDDESDDDSDDDPLSQLMFHIQCYLLADKYEIKLMTQRALDKTRQLLAHEAYHFCEGFPTAVHFVYANTVAATQSGRQLRDAVLCVCDDNLRSLLLNPRFDATLGGVADFWRELARARRKGCCGRRAPCGSSAPSATAASRACSRAIPTTAQSPPSGAPLAASSRPVLTSGPPATPCPPPPTSRAPRSARRSARCSSRERCAR